LPADCYPNENAKFGHSDPEKDKPDNSEDQDREGDADDQYQ
jgi:hypothetical protein